MEERKNVALEDDMMAMANGGITDNIPYGYVCEATVAEGPESMPFGGVTGTAYRVVADNGEKYLASWDYRSTLNPGDRVQLIHVEWGFALEPIVF